MAVDALCRLRVLEPLLRLVLPRARVLEPILPFADAVCAGFGTRSLSYQRCMHSLCLISAAEDVLTSERSLLHVPCDDFNCPCLQSMCSRGISCYRIPVGCPVAASPPGM